MWRQKRDTKGVTAKRWLFALLVAIPTGILLNMLFRYATGRPSAGLFQVMAWSDRGLKYPRSTIYMVVAITTPTIYACYVSRPSSRRRAVAWVLTIAVVVGALAAVTDAWALFLVPIGTVVIAGLWDADPAERPYRLAFPLAFLAVVVAIDERFSPSMALVLFVLLAIVVPIVYDLLVDGKSTVLHSSIGIAGLSAVTAVAYLLTLLAGLQVGGSVGNSPFVTFREALMIGPAVVVGTAAPALLAMAWRRVRSAL